MFSKIDHMMNHKASWTSSKGLKPFNILPYYSGIKLNDQRKRVEAIMILTLSIMPVNVMNLIHAEEFSVCLCRAPYNLISYYHWLSLIRNADDKVDSDVSSQEIPQEADFCVNKHIRYDKCN